MLLISFFPPDGITINAFVSNIYWVGKLLAFVYILLLILKDRKFTFSIEVVFIVGIFGIQGLATAVNYGNLSKDVSTFITSVFFTFFVSWAIKRDCKNFLDATVGLIGLLALINLFTVLLLFGEGLAKNEVDQPIYFWASDNHFASLLVFGIILAFINNKIHDGDRKKMFILMLIISSVTILSVWSATAVVGWFIVTVGILFISIFPQLIKKFNYINAIVIGAILQIWIVLFRAQNIFEYIIVDVLKKSMTFSNRSYIWDFAIATIQKNPVFGLGNPSSFGLQGWYLDQWSGFIFMHNEFLEWFVNGGFLAFLLFVLFMVWPIRIMYKNRQLVEVSALSIGVLAALIMMITEALTPRAPFIIMIVLCYHVRNFYKSEIQGE